MDLDDASSAASLEIAMGTMMQQRAIAIFVKTPELSPVKTRLRAGIGEAHALEFYQLALDVARETTEAVNATCYWAVAEEDGLAQWQDRPVIWTGNGDLGQRQNHIYSHLRESHEHVMLMSSDCPQLTPTILEEAFAALGTHDYAIGPAEDGGYNFIAGRKDIPQDVWTSVTYSTDTTRKDLIAKLDGSIYETVAFSDIDTVEDLQVMLQQMPDTPSPTQLTLIEWALALDATSTAA